MQMANIQINSIGNYVTDTKENYTIHVFTCEGFVDGVPNNAITIKTFSGKYAGKIQTGEVNQINCEVDNFKGNLSYKVPKALYSDPSYNNGGQQAPAQQPVYQAPAQQQAPVQQAPVQKFQPATFNSTGYTLEELKYLYADLWNFVIGSVTKEETAVQPATATLFIQATRCNLKAPAEEVIQPTYQAPANPVNAQATANAHQALEAVGLLARVNAGQVPAEIVEEWWVSAGGDQNKFAIEVNKILQEQGL